MRRLLTALLFWATALGGLAAVAVQWFFWTDRAFRDSVVARTGRNGEAFCEPFFSLAIGFGVAVVIAYFLSLDPRRRRRPWVGLTAASLAPGATGALAGFTYANLEYSGAAAMAGIAVGGGLASAAIVLGFEFLNRWLWSRIVEGLDRKDMGGAALLIGRVALLWHPGHEHLMRSVVLERFRRGTRAEVAEQLEAMYAAGDRGADLLEILCQWANECQNPPKFLEYLGALYGQFPDDSQLRTAYLEELLGQGKDDEALEIAQKHGVGKSEDSLEKYAGLLIRKKLWEQAVEQARLLGEVEGIPLRRSEKILRDILSAAGDRIDALNLLAAQAERMARKDQLIRWLEKSVALNRHQSDKRMKLLALYELTEQPKKSEDLLAEMVADSPSDFGMGMKYAGVLFANGKLAEAVEILELLRSRGCVWVESFVLYARAKFELGDMTGAEAAAREALTHVTNESQDQLLRTLLRKIEHAALTTELAQTLERSNACPEDLDLALDAIRRLMAAGHPERAVSHADMTLGQHPEARAAIVAALNVPNAKGAITESFAVLNFVSDLQVAAGDLDAALETIKRMASRGVDKVTALRDAAQKILRRSPHHLATLKALGDAYLEKGLFTEMIHSYSLYLLNGGEKNESVDRAMANAYLALNDYTNAHRYVTSLLEIAPDTEANVDLLRRTIKLAIQVNRPQEAAEYLKRLEVVAPGEKETRQLRETVTFALGHERLQFLKHELEAGKGEQPVLEEIGDICRQRAELNDAIAYYQRATRMPGATRLPLVKLAWCFAKKGVYDMVGETLQDLRLSLDDDPDELQNLMLWLYNIASLLEEAHMYQRSLKLYKQLLKIDAGYRDVITKVEQLSIK